MDEIESKETGGGERAEFLPGDVICSAYHYTQEPRIVVRCGKTIGSQLVSKPLHELTPEQKTRLLAELDGCQVPPTWYCGFCRETVKPEQVTHDERHDERGGGCGNDVHADYKPYLTSYDAIIPLVQKFDRMNHALIVKFLNTLRSIAETNGKFPINERGTKLVSDYDLLFQTTPSQLCDAVLVATGKSEL